MGKELKKIRIDYYQYRVRKGRVDILLERDSTDDSFFVPCHYALDSDRITPQDFWKGNVEDDGDLVILRCSVNNCHIDRKNKEWIPLSNLSKINFSKGDTGKVLQYCLANFLELNFPAEAALIEKVKQQFEDVLVARAKEEYIEELTRVLNGESLLYFDAVVSPPDADLLKEEIATMAHFKLFKRERLGESYRSMRYSYESIPWETFGAKIEPIMLRLESPIQDDLKSIFR